MDVADPLGYIAAPCEHHDALPRRCVRTVIGLADRRLLSITKFDGLFLGLKIGDGRLCTK
jgi:hypothetical protein